MSNQRINQEIRAKSLRVIDVNGEQLGVISTQEALKLAQKHKVDLVEISPDSNPPVAKLIDWGKYQYKKMKQQKKNRQNDRANELKQMSFGLKISQNDLQIKLRKVQSFLDKGHKVKILIVFKGREIAHKELGQEKIKEIIDTFGDSIILQQSPQMSGRNLSIIIRSK